MSTITSPVHRSPLPAPAGEPAVATAFLRHAAADPGAVAVVDGATGETLTRGELAARSAALAAGLRAGGVRPGDLVAVAMPNLAWWPVVALGVWRAGAAISPLSPLWTADESARVLAGAVPRAAIAFAPVAADRSRARSRARACTTSISRSSAATRPTRRRSRRSWPSTAETPTPSPTSGPEDLAAVPFSSGTGGLPKGVRITHGNLAAARGTGGGGLPRRRRLRRAIGRPRRRAVLPRDRPRAHALRAAERRREHRHPPPPGPRAPAGARRRPPRDPRCRAAAALRRARHGPACRRA